MISALWLRYIPIKSLVLKKKKEEALKYMEGARENTENGERVTKRMTRMNVQYGKKNSCLHLVSRRMLLITKLCEYFLKHLHFTFCY